MTHRVMFRVVVLLVLLAACALPRPGFDLIISQTAVTPSREGSFCQSGGCTGACGDGPAPEAPLTVVRTSAPVRLDFAAGDEVNRIRADIYAGDRMAGSPIESFTLSGTERSHTSTQMRTGRYYILVTIGWSRLTDRGDSGRAFLVEIVPP
jgi:hypothetical protein